MKFNKRSQYFIGSHDEPLSVAMHAYEVRPRKDKRGVDLVSDALPFGRLWQGEPNAVANAIRYAQHRSRSHDAVSCVYDESGNVIETHEHTGDVKSVLSFLTRKVSTSLTRLE